MAFITIKVTGAKERTPSLMTLYFLYKQWLNSVQVQATLDRTGALWSLVNVLFSLSFVILFLFKTKRRYSTCLERFFSLLMGVWSREKWNTFCTYYWYFHLVMLALYFSLESAMMTRLSSSRLVRKSTKLFWHTVWTEVVRSAS